MDNLTLTIKGQDFTVDWPHDRDPTQAEIETIAKQIGLQEGLIQDPGFGGAKAKIAQTESKQSGNWRLLMQFAEAEGFKVTGKNETTGHNPGSRHYIGKAIDIRTRDKTPEEVAAIIAKAKSLGINVLDERKRPKGQAVWTGPHLHLSLDDHAVERLQGYLGGTKPKPKQGELAPSNTDLGKVVNQIFQPTKPKAPAQAAAPKSLYDVIKTKTGVDVEAKIAAERQANPGATQTQLHQQHPGTIENAMVQIDSVFGRNITADKRAAIKSFLLQFGDGNIPDNAVSTAVALANAGQYARLKALGKPDQAVGRLSFNLADYIVARNTGKRVVPFKDDDTGAVLSITKAEEQLQKVLGLSKSEIAAKKPVAAFAKLLSNPTARVLEADEIANPMDVLLGSVMGDDAVANFFKAPAHGFAVFPDVLQDVAGQALGMQRGAVLADADIQGNQVGAFGKTVFQIAKYFTPGGAVAIGSDLAAITGRAKEVGPVQAGTEAVEGILQAANVFEAGIGTGERIARGLNGILLAWGLTHGAVKAYQAGDRYLAAKEVGDKIGVGRLEAYRLLRDAETHVKTYINEQVQLGRDTHTARNFVALHDAYEQAKAAGQPIKDYLPVARNPKPTDSPTVTETTPSPAQAPDFDPVPDFTPSPDGRIVAIVQADPRWAETNAAKYELERQLAAGEIDKPTYNAKLKELPKVDNAGDLLYVELNLEQQKLYDAANQKYREDGYFLDELARKGELTHEALNREKANLITDLHKQHRQIAGYPLDGEGPAPIESAPLIAVERAGPGHSNVGAVPFKENMLIGRGKYYDIREGPEDLPQGVNKRQQAAQYAAKPEAEGSLETPAPELVLGRELTPDQVARLKKAIESADELEPDDLPDATTIGRRPEPTQAETDQALVNIERRIATEPTKREKLKTRADDARKRLSEFSKYTQGPGAGLGGLDPQVFSDLIIVAADYLLDAAGSVASVSKRLIEEFGLTKKQAADFINRAIDSHILEHVGNVIRDSRSKTESLRNLRADLGGLGERNVKRLYSAGLKQVQAGWYPTHLIGRQKVQLQHVGRGRDVYRNKAYNVVNVPEGTKPVDIISLDGKGDSLRLTVLDLIDKHLQVTQSLRSLTEDRSVLDAERLRNQLETLEHQIKLVVKEHHPHIDDETASLWVKREVLQHLVINSTEDVLDYVVNNADTILSELDIQTIKAHIAERDTNMADFTNDLVQGSIRPQDFSAVSGEEYLLRVRVSLSEDLVDELMPYIVRAQHQGRLDTAISLWKVGLITTFRNPMVNAKGNTLTSAGLTLSRGPRAGVDWLLSKGTGNRTRLGWVNGADALMHNARLTVAKETAVAMRDAFKGELSTTDRVKLDTGRKWNTEKWVGPIPPAMSNWIINHGFGLVQAWDKPFYMTAYRRSLEELANILAKNEGLSGDDFAKRVQELRETPTDEMKWQAHGDAEYSVLAGKNALADYFKAGNRSLRKDGLGSARAAIDEILLPFKTIPFNVAKMGIEWAGGGVINGTFRLGSAVLETKRRGAITWGRAIKNTLEELPVDEQRRISDAIGNGLTGAGIMSLGYMLYMHNPKSITPYKPSDPNTISEEEALGQREGSVSIFGYDVDLTESAIGRLFAAGASIAAYVKGDFDHDGQSPGKLATAQSIVGEVIDSPLNTSSSVLSDLLKGNSDAFGNYLRNTAGSTVPGLVNEIGLMTNPEARVIERSAPGAGDRIKSRIPGVKAGLPQRTDVFGQILGKQSYPLEKFLLNTIGATKPTGNPVALELERLGIPFSRPQRRKADAKWQDDGQPDPRFDRTEADYQERIAFVGIRKQQAGLEILADPDYQAETDEGKRQLFKQVLNEVGELANQELDVIRAEQGYQAARAYIWQEVLKGQVVD